jgi:hypothetical protein
MPAKSTGREASKAARVNPFTETTRSLQAARPAKVDLGLGDLAIANAPGSRLPGGP